MSNVNFDLLDSSVEDLLDSEGFSPIPAGTHRAIIGWDTKEINDKPAVILSLKVVETLEMASSSESAPEPGKSSDIAFILLDKNGERNSISESQLKEIVTALSPTFGGGSVRETMTNSEGAEVIVTLKVRASKKDPDQKFNQIVTISAA